ncbi:HNH endonuclease [Mycobacterium sp. MS1601]|uniref:HNH endonuclease signature motif containing protein n=1 Tax=Mycobacterium sp. MS1601 TaxID=1936029 RepID=UPI00097911C2|nr:HNH endonuclease signature motif containing protein [Mycobacterium sp. MS1601]AQA01440.1 HNH endonuclease [Mycobacterium sp. MS1601]
MSTTATPLAAAGENPQQRFEVLFGRLGELAGQRNAIDGEIVEIIAEIDRDGLAGNTGFRSIEALVACKTGVSPHRAKTATTIARRSAEFPRCTDAMREGWLSLDQVGVIATKAGAGSDAHYVQFAKYATVQQIRTAIKQEPKPEPLPDAEPAPQPEPERSLTQTSDGESTTWHVTLASEEAAEFDAALRSHQDKLVVEWKRDHTEESETTPPFPTPVDGFMSLVRAGWDTDVTARPHGQRTTVVVHLDLESRLANLHLGPLLSDADRQYLLCDATCEVWFERHGKPIGSGRETRTISRRLRRALEHRDSGTCVVPGCGATRGLHAHHLRHWEDGGPTELWNLVLVCPFHHRMHHRGRITLTGPADGLVVADATGRRMTAGSLARPPTTPRPDVPPPFGPTGERCDWWWYTPYQPPTDTAC